MSRWEAASLRLPDPRRRARGSRRGLPAHRRPRRRRRGAGVGLVLGRPAPRRLPRRAAAVATRAAGGDRGADLDDPAGHGGRRRAAGESPRLAEDAATVDVLSGGRLELGVGAGADPAASARFGRDHERRHEDCAAVLDELVDLAESDGIVPRGLGWHRRLWWATGSRAGLDAAAARGIGVMSGRPADAPGSTVADDLAHYRQRAATPRVLLSRIVEEDGDAAETIARWRRDPARRWSTGLVVQTQPARAGFDRQLRVMGRVAEELRAAPAMELAR